MMVNITFFALLLFFIACTQQTSSMEDDLETNIKNSLMSENILEEENAGKGEKMVIYQIMTRLFGNKVSTNKEYGTREENGVGKFEDINDAALRSLNELGITHVWYTGVLEHALMADYRKFGIALDDADVVKGRAGSPYAIKDYYDVNPDLATNVNSRMKEFEDLVKRTHAHDLKVLIDFVPNHVARSYHSDAKPAGIEDLGEKDDKTQSFHHDNNFYYLVGQPFKVPEGYVPLGPDHSFMTKDGHFEEVPAKATGNNKFEAQPEINDWFETVKLNYGIDYLNQNQKHFDPVPSTWQKMLEILNFWAGKNIDGFRCDMAEMVPVEFWNWVIPQVKKEFPSVIFIAEIYNPQQYKNYIDQGKFDFLYDKVQLYDTLRNIITGQSTTEHLNTIWKELKGINHKMLRFLENHDEQRIASPQFAGDPLKAIPGMVISATLYTGPVMIYFGQEVGEPGAGKAGFSGEDGRTTIYDYWGVPEHQKWMNNGSFNEELLDEKQKKLRNFYSELLNLSHKSEAISKGKLIDIHHFNKNIKSNGYNEKVYAFLRFTDREKILIISNFNDHSIPGLTVSIPEQNIIDLGLNKKNTLPVVVILNSEANPADTSQFNQLKKRNNYYTLEISAQPYSAYIFKIE